MEFLQAGKDLENCLARWKFFQNNVYGIIKNGKYIAYIGFQRKLYHLGTFENFSEAVEARRRAETKMYGNFLEWYSKEYPKKWEKMKERKEKKSPG